MPVNSAWGKATFLLLERLLLAVVGVSLRTQPQLGNCHHSQQICSQHCLLVHFSLSFLFLELCHTLSRLLA